MLTKLQKQTAQAIVNVFETGRPQGDYGKVTLLPGDSGHLTYGRAQTTLASGNLCLLIRAYCAAPEAAYARPLTRYLDRLEAPDLSLDHDVPFRTMLQDAGQDPVMQGAQDAFFDRVYWAASLQSAEALGITSPLGITVVYDSRIHGSWDRIRDRTISAHGRPEQGSEERWIEGYVATRRAWLAHHANPLLHRTVYRMDAFKSLIAERKWTLRLPIRVQGVEITRTTFDTLQPSRPSAEGATRVLGLRHPLLRGDDVGAVQNALVAAGHMVEIDGVFGPETAAALKAFQNRHGLVVDGAAGPATRAALGL